MSGEADDLMVQPDLCCGDRRLLLSNFSEHFRRRLPQITPKVSDVMLIIFFTAALKALGTSCATFVRSPFECRLAV